MGEGPRAYRKRVAEDVSSRRASPLLDGASAMSNADATWSDGVLWRSEGNVCVPVSGQSLTQRLYGLRDGDMMPDLDKLTGPSIREYTQQDWEAARAWEKKQAEFKVWIDAMTASPISAASYSACAAVSDNVEGCGGVAEFVDGVAGAFGDHKDQVEKIRSFGPVR